MKVGRFWISLVSHSGFFFIFFDQFFPECEKKCQKKMGNLTSWAIKKKSASRKKNFFGNFCIQGGFLFWANWRNFSSFRSLISPFSMLWAEDGSGARTVGWLRIKSRRSTFFQHWESDFREIEKPNDAEKKARVAQNKNLFCRDPSVFF